MSDEGARPPSQPPSGSRAAPRAVGLCLLVALAGPLVVVFGMMGARYGAWPADFGYRTLGLSVGLGLTIVGALAAVAGAVIAWRGAQRFWALGLAGLVSVHALIFLWAAGERHLLVTEPAVAEASSDWADRPSFSSALMADRRRNDAKALLTEGETDWCPGLVTVPRQVAPHEVRMALERAGFQVIGVSPFRAEGQLTSFWYGFTQDVVVRIRPGATDVRVAGRDDRADGGSACGLAKRVAAGLR